MKHDDRKLDAILENAVDDTPAEEIIFAVTPWKKAMRRVILGIALSALTLHFFALEYILPTIGMLCMFLGFRTLRRENRWFGRCYILALLRLFLSLPVLIGHAIVHVRQLYDSPMGMVYSGLLVVLQFVLLFCLWQGIRTVERKADMPARAGGAAMMMAYHGIVCILSLLEYDGTIVLLILIAMYILALCSLWQLAAELDTAGYVIEAAPIRVPDAAVVAAVAATLAVGLTCAYLFGGGYSMKWEQKTCADDEEILEIREHLISLGFPEEILDDLTEADIRDCRDARRVVVSAHSYPFNEGRVAEEYRDMSNSRVMESGYYTTTVYDVQELTITGIAVELARGEREQWKILHHFRWTVDPGYFGTECIQLWPTYREGNDGWTAVGDWSGQVLVDIDGVAWCAPYTTLGTVSYTSNSVFWGESERTDVFAEFSFPQEGEAQRGYVSYTILEMRDGWIVDSWINYTHQQTWAQYPALSAREQRMKDSFNSAGAFLTVQDALQFYPTDSAVDLFDEP